VRDLFDSMYRGFPVGYLLFWENAQAAGAKKIGVGEKAHTVTSRLIVDGQQRLGRRGGLGPVEGVDHAERF